MLELSATPASSLKQARLGQSADRHRDVPGPHQILATQAARRWAGELVCPGSYGYQSGT
jgi:hypothetical protein